MGFFVFKAKGLGERAEDKGRKWTGDSVQWIVINNFYHRELVSGIK